MVYGSDSVNGYCVKIIVEILNYIPTFNNSLIILKIAVGKYLLYKVPTIYIFKDSPLTSKIFDYSPPTL